MLNEAGFNFSRGAIISTPAGMTSKGNSPDVNLNLPFPNTQGVVPALSFTGGSSVIGYGPYTEYNRNYAFFDNFNWIHGRHSLKFGATFNRYQKTENAAGNNSGTFAFTQNGVPAGTTNYAQSFANFLMGNVSTFTQNSMDITPNLWAWQNEAYAQDDFQVRRNLTLYAGVRWSYFGQPSDSNGLLTNFDPGLYSTANAPQINPANGLIVAGTGNNYLTNGIITAGKNSPWGGKIAPVGKSNFAPRLGLSWDPFGTGKTSIRAGYGVYYDATLMGVYEQNIFTNPPFVQSVNISNTTFQNPGGGTVNVSLSPLVLRGTPLPYNTPYTQHWSLNIQQQLTKDVVLEIGYFGSKGTHLPGIVDINQAYPGVALAAGLHTGAAGTTIFTTSDTPRINSVRPYLGFNAINTIETAFDSNYHSLQTNVRKNFGAKGLIGGAFTWSKNMTDNASDRSNAPQNSYDWHDGEYGPATLDRKLVLTVNYVYHLPFFANSKGVMHSVLGGWEVSGVTSYYSGAPLTVTTSSVDPAGLGLLGSSAASSRPDMLCDPNANAPQLVGLNATWFNTACFAPVPQGVVRPGNAGRGVVRAPGFGKWDVTLLKNFALGERRSLQLRGETYNLLNHGNPGAPTTNITSTVFGQITSFRDPRLIQLGVKLYF